MVDAAPQPAGVLIVGKVSGSSRRALGEILIAGSPLKMRLKASKVIPWRRSGPSGPELPEVIGDEKSGLGDFLDIFGGVSGGDFFHQKSLRCYLEQAEVGGH